MHFFFFFKWQDNLNSIVKSFLIICTRTSSFKLTLSKRLINRNCIFSQFYQTLNCDFKNRDSETLSLKSLFLKMFFFKQLPKWTLSSRSKQKKMFLTPEIEMRERMFGLVCCAKGPLEALPQTWLIVQNNLTWERSTNNYGTKELARK